LQAPVEPQRDHAPESISVLGQQRPQAPPIPLGRLLEQAVRLIRVSGHARRPNLDDLLEKPGRRIDAYRAHRIEASNH
jgi:hypothetical protein